MGPVTVPESARGGCALGRTSVESGCALGRASVESGSRAIELWIGDMDREQLFRILRSEMATVLEVDENDIQESSYLVADLDADSIDLLDMVLSLKERFGIVINDGEVKELLRELARFLPDRSVTSADFSDKELAEVSRQLRVATIVDFVMDRAATRA